MKMDKNVYFHFKNFKIFCRQDNAPHIQPCQHLVPQNKIWLCACTQMNFLKIFCRAMFTAVQCWPPMVCQNKTIISMLTNGLPFMSHNQQHQSLDVKTSLILNKRTEYTKQKQNIINPNNHGAYCDVCTWQWAFDIVISIEYVDFYITIVIIQLLTAIQNKPTHATQLIHTAGRDQCRSQIPHC